MNCAEDSCSLIWNQQRGIPANTPAPGSGIKQSEPCRRRATGSHYRTNHTMHWLPTKPDIQGQNVTTIPGNTRPPCGACRRCLYPASCCALQQKSVGDTCGSGITTQLWRCEFYVACDKSAIYRLHMLTQVTWRIYI